MPTYNIWRELAMTMADLLQGYKPEDWKKQVILDFLILLGREKISKDDFKMKILPLIQKIDPDKSIRKGFHRNLLKKLVQESY